MSSVDQALVVRLEASLRQFEKSMEKARTVGDRTATGLQRQFDQTNQRISRSSAHAARGLLSVTNVSTQGRAVLQNTAAQIGDIAVQLEGGTSASRVMAQQLPQLFGGFASLGGALGLVMPLLGTLAAVGIPAAAMLLTMGNNSEEAEEQVRTFVERLRDAESAIERAASAADMASTGALEDIREKFGAVTDEVRRMLDELARMERVAAARELQDLFGEAFNDGFQQELDRLFGGVGTAIVSATQDQIDAQRALIDELETDLANLMAMGQGDMPAGRVIAADLRAAREELAALEGRFDEIGSLGDELVSPDLLFRIAELQSALQEAFDQQRFGDVLAIIDQLRGSIQSVADASGGVTPEMQATLDKLTQIQSSAQQLAVVMGDVETETDRAAVAAETLSYALDQAARSDLSGLGAQAAFLAQQLGLSADEAARLNAALPGGAAAPEGRRLTFGMGSDGAADPTLGDANLTFGSNPGGAGRRSVTALPEVPGASGSGRSRSGGGAAATQDHTAAIRRQVEALQVQIDTLGMTASETARLRAERDALSAAQRAGADLDRVNTETGRTLREEIALQADEVGRLTEQLEQGQTSWQAFEQGIKSVADAMASAIVDSENMGDAIRGVFRQIAQSWISNNIQNILTSLGGSFGFGGGGGGGFLSRILGGRATGGSVLAGGIYPVNENTPNSELFVPSVSGAVLTPRQVQDGLARSMAARGGAGDGRVDVRVYVDQDGNWQAKVEQISGRVVQGAGPGLTRQAVGAAQAAFRNSKAGWTP